MTRALAVLTACLLAGCSTKPQTDPAATLQMIEQLRGQQQASAPLTLEYRESALVLNPEQEQTLHRYIAERDPATLTLSAGPADQGDSLADARLASNRLSQLARLLAPRAVTLELRYDPALPVNALRVVSRP